MRAACTLPDPAPITKKSTSNAMVEPSVAPDKSSFKNGRQFEAWLGLVAKQRSSGGRAWVSANTTRVPVKGWIIWLSHLIASSTVGQADLVLCKPSPEPGSNATACSPVLRGNVADLRRGA